jgi:hypothetical protein
MAKHHPDLIMCRKQPGIAIGRLCEKCDGMLSFLEFYFDMCRALGLPFCSISPFAVWLRAHERSPPSLSVSLFVSQSLYLFKRFGRWIFYFLPHHFPRQVRRLRLVRAPGDAGSRVRRMQLRLVPGPLRDLRRCVCDVSLPSFARASFLVGLISYICFEFKLSFFFLCIQSCGHLFPISTVVELPDYRCLFPPYSDFHIYISRTLIPSTHRVAAQVKASLMHTIAKNAPSWRRIATDARKLSTLAAPKQIYFTNGKRYNLQSVLHFSVPFDFLCCESRFVSNLNILANSL